MKITLILILLSIAINAHELTKFEHKPLAVLPRQRAPFWSGIAVEGEKFVKKSSEEYKGGYLIMLFYPFDFTYVCPTELISFSENIQKFAEINTKVIGISTDSHFTHLAWIKTPRQQGGVGKLNFPLLADISKNISRNYQVLVEDEADGLYGAALRGLFIIDEKGVIRSFTINDAPVGRSVDETIRLIQAFQHADKFGEVCPANWKPGDNTINPDPEKKIEYFEKTYHDL
jgi:peroxiredoxin (alkyl hydroperoxide reductase subunit C)